MNILKRELRAGLKPFLFWILGLFVLVFMGVVKSTGVSGGGESFQKLADSFPRIVLAVFGIMGIDIGSFGGYYAVLAQYAAIVTAVYAVHLGYNAVSRESVDKTYEFVFTKPRSRSFILARKLLAGFLYLTAFCILDYLFSAAATAKLGIEEDLTTEFWLFTLGSWLVGLLFFSLAVMFAAMARSAEKGSKLGNISILVGFAAGVAYDMMNNGGIVRLFAPFRYFTSSEVLSGELNLLYAALCVAVAAVSLVIAFRRFERRDLSAA